jgi:NitT/TauT family transport system substrate-binding protein
VNLRRSEVIRGIALAMGASAARPLPSYAQGPTPIVADGVITIDTVPLWYGIQQGLFARAALDVNYQRATSGTMATLAVVANSAQVGDTNTLSLLQARVKGIAIEAIAPLSLYDSTTNYIAAVVAKDSPLREARDLNGRVIGSQGAKDMSAMALLAWMDQNGGDSKSVKILELPSSTMAAALAEGRIDAGTLQQPFLSDALASAKVRIFANTYASIGKRFLFGVWIANTAWVAANSEAVRQFARVLLEGQIWANAHRAEAAALTAKYTGIDEQIIVHGGMQGFSSRLIEAQDMQPVIDTAFKYGAIDKRLQAADLISPAVRSPRR